MNEVDNYVKIFLFDNQDRNLNQNELLIEFIVAFCEQNSMPISFLKQQMREIDLESINYNFINRPLTDY